MKDVLLSPHPVDHPYLNLLQGKRRLYVVVAGDKGMVGSYNTDILRFAAKELDENPDSLLITIGTMAERFFRARGKEPDFIMAGLSQDPSLINARALVSDIIALYDSAEARSVYVIYTEFLRDSAAKPVMHRILPIRIHDYDDVQAIPHEIEYFPSANEVFAKLIPQYLVGIVFGSLVHSYASEHFARMNAMHSATENADELLKSLSLQYNTSRQAAITTEIAEISSAAAAGTEGTADYE